MSTEKKKSYLEQRVYEQCGLTPEQCAVPLYNGRYPALVLTRKYKDKKTGEDKEQVVLDKNGDPKPAPFPLFQSDKHDNIRMYPYTLDGQIITYLADKQPKHGAEAGDLHEIYYVTRRHPDFLKENPNMPKYDFPGGETKKGTYPFFPPNIYEAYRKKQHIETLVLTEGYMKAMTASTRGMYVVGLGSITLFADSKTKQLYPDIIRLLNVCKPDNIVILYDGDCRDIKKEDIGARENGKLKDLAKRPQIFKSVLLKLREMLLEFRTEKGDPCELYFAYVKKMREIDPPKGLDDIIVDEAYKDETADIADDLNHPGRPGIYFQKLNLRTGLNKVDALFNLKSPQKFYEEWAEEIGEQQFRFEGGQYQYSKSEKKLITLLDSTWDDYIAVGSEICLVTEEPIANANGTEWKLYPKSDKVINARLGDGAAKRLYQYKYYEDYTICPSHENYSKEVVNKKGYRFFNMYSPLPYEPEPGEWPTINKLLHQITKEYPEERFHYYEMLLDWITLTYIKPLQFLPIIMLVSKDRGTGKTSFLNLLKYIYGHNAVIGGNDLIVSKFNSLLAGKLIVGVDESCLGDNKEVGESLKYMSTSKTIHVEMKGKDKKEMPAFCKFVLASNEVRKGIFIAKDEIRFWVMRLSPWADEEYDTDFEDRIEGEVPAFLNALKERYYKGKMFVPEKKHRMWFDPQMLVNEDLSTMMSGTSSNFEGSLDSFLKEMFLDTGKAILHFDIPYILDNIDGAKKRGENSIRILLDDKLGVKRIAKSDRYSMPFRVTAAMKQSDTTLQEDEGEVMWPTKKKVCRPYEFDAKYFLTDEEYCGLKCNKDKEKEKAIADTQQSIPMEETAPKPDAATPNHDSGALVEAEDTDTDVF